MGERPSRWKDKAIKTQSSCLFFLNDTLNSSLAWDDQVGRGGKKGLKNGMQEETVRIKGN